MRWCSSDLSQSWTSIHGCFSWVSLYITNFIRMMTRHETTITSEYLIFIPLLFWSTEPYMNAAKSPVDILLFYRKDKLVQMHFEQRKKKNTKGKSFPLIYCIFLKPRLTTIIAVNFSNINSKKHLHGWVNHCKTSPCRLYGLEQQECT